MLKKSLITILIFSLVLIITTPVFAANVKEGAENTLNNIRGGIQSMTNDVGHGMESVGNNMGSNDDNKNNDNRDNSDTQNNDLGIAGDYTASRTSATDSVQRYNSNFNVTVWIVMIIAAAIIIALVWYYATQTNNRD